MHNGLQRPVDQHIVSYILERIRELSHIERFTYREDDLKITLTREQMDRLIFLDDELRKHSAIVKEIEDIIWSQS